MALWKDPIAKDTESATREMARDFERQGDPFIEKSVLEKSTADKSLDRSSITAVTSDSRKGKLEGRGDGKESLIASDITIEGKIEGAGHVRIAGRFKGDVHVQGNLTIEQGARLTGEVRANTVIVGGELEGNIEAASRVELQQSGVLIGDLKAGSLIVAAGSRMRGRAEFGWEDTAATAQPIGAAKSSF